MKIPGIQGDRLIEELAKLGGLPTIITITGDPVAGEMKTKLERFGCEYFVTKPFDLIEIVELAKTVSAQKGLLG